MGKLRPGSQILLLQQGSRGPTLGVEEIEIFLRELNLGVAQPNPSSILQARSRIVL